MKKHIDNYTFSKAAKQITFTDLASISLDRILIVTNVTRNIIIYLFSDATLGGTVATNVLTLTYDTAAMADTDKLLIYYDDTALPAQEAGGNLAAILLELQTQTISQIADLSLSIKVLAQYIANPVSLDKTINRVRETSVIESGTITEVTTVPTVTNLTKFGALTPEYFMFIQNNINWSEIVRRTIS